MSNEAVIIPSITGDAVGAIEIDAVLEETHTLANTVTDHPVEQGYNITDHSRPEPDTVTMRCFISNTPLSTTQQTRSIDAGDTKNTQFTSNTQQDVKIGDTNGRGNNAYEKLKKLRVTGALVQIVTSLTVYKVTSTEGMIITSISIPRTAENFDGLEFSISFKQIRIVRNRSTTDVKQKEKQTRKPTKEGSKPTQDAPVDNRGALEKIVENNDTLTKLVPIGSGF